MSTKLKAVGTGLLALMAMSAFAVMNATAEMGGHFVSEAEHTVVKGKESGANHRFHFRGHGIEGEIGCATASYEGTAQSATKTVTEIKVTPKYETCGTTPNHNVTVDVTGCAYTFTVGKQEPPHGSVDLECTLGGDTSEPTGHIVITHPNCTITITGSKHTGENQTLTGFSYHTIIGDNGKHAITLGGTTVNGQPTQAQIQFKTRYEGGICVFTGTNHTGTLIGSATVEGFNKLGGGVGITATGNP